MNKCLQGYLHGRMRVLKYIQEYDYTTILEYVNRSISI